MPDDRQPSPEALGNSFFTAVEQGKQLVERHPEIDLLAFPENPESFFFNTDTHRRRALGGLISATGKPVVLVVDAKEDPANPGGVPVLFNIAVHLDSERNLAGYYPKMKRLPLVEYLPGEGNLPLLRKWFPRSLNVGAGEEPVLFEAGEGVRIIPLICYEAILSSFTRDFIRRGGNFIVNQVNDSWFLQTPAPEVHLALALFRTVEYRVPMVRVTNSGIGAHIGADGRIVPGSRTGLFAEAATAFPLFVPDKRTLYARVGKWWMLGFAPLFFSRWEKPSANEKPGRFAPP